LSLVKRRRHPGQLLRRPGLNYRAQSSGRTARTAAPTKVPERADVGYRSNNALIGSGEDIVIPSDSSGKVDFEASSLP
jgi:hypothetical protein